VITAITIDTLTKFFLWKEIDYLGENSLALVHGEAPFASFYAKKTTNPGLWQIQIDPFQIRQYLKCLHMVTLCSKNLNRTVVMLNIAFNMLIISRFYYRWEQRNREFYTLSLYRPVFMAA